MKNKKEEKKKMMMMMMMIIIIMVMMLILKFYHAINQARSIIINSIKHKSCLKKAKIFYENQT
jgi:uncharacterized membrane protein